jgi:hypothetical protein
VYPDHMNRAFTALLMTLTAAAVLLPAQVTRAAAASDIPGTALSARTLVSAVGGPTVDEVYAVNVPDGSVLVATVRGEAGSELGLYLFDTDATSIFTANPLVQSAKPGGVQSLSAAIQVGGTFYLNINGRNSDRPHAYTLSIAIARDTTPPSIVAAAMPARARSASVCATVKASDVTSGVRSIRVRELGNPAAAAWVGYLGEGSYCVATSSGSGARAFDVTVRNGVGLISVPRAFSVFVDDLAPTLLRSNPPQGSVLLEPRASITWRFSEPVRLAGGLSDNIFAVNQAGVRIGGSASVVGDGSRIRWTPTVNLPPGSILLVAIAGVRDVAGNEALPIESLELFRKQPARIGLTRAGVGARWTRFSYSVSENLVGRELLLETFADGAWQVSSTITPERSGGSLRVERNSGVAVRVRWVGDERVNQVTSRRVALSD